MLLPEQTSPRHLMAEGTLGLLRARTDAAHQHPSDDEYKVYSAHVPNLESETSQTFSCTVTRTLELWNWLDQNKVDIKSKSLRRKQHCLDQHTARYKQKDISL